MLIALVARLLLSSLQTTVTLRCFAVERPIFMGEHNDDPFLLVHS